MSGLRGKWRGKFAALVLTAALGGCVAPPATPSPSPDASRPAGTDPAASPSVAGKSLPTDAVPDASPEAPPEIVAPLPETLLGKDRAEIVYILGEPTFRRNDAPALLMRYRDKRCILDLFLYLPAGANGAGSPAVKHVEARGLDGGKIATRGCIDSVMKSRAAGKSG